MRIGIFDSGKGGMSVFDEIKKILPDEEYKYIADSKNCPYGSKSDRELLKITNDIVKELKDWGAEIVVVACNTATTRCIKNLRINYPEIKFVGTEPAVKLAAETNAKKILIMATPGTIRSERLMRLLKENKKSGQEVDLLACPGLADAVEKDEGVDEVLREILGSVGKYDLVVLGCTHYSLIKEKIRQYFPGAKLIDGNEGVARRVKQLVENLWKND